MKNRHLMISLGVIIISISVFKLSSIVVAMTAAQRNSLLGQSTNFGSNLNSNVNVQALQNTVTIPQINQTQQQKLQSYVNSPQQMQTDGSNAITNSGTNSFFIKGRSQYNFTQNDPLIKNAGTVKSGNNTQCNSNTVTTNGVTTTSKSQIQTCEVFRNYDMKSCNVTQGTAYNCNFSTNNIYNRNGADKVSLNIACAGTDNISVTVDAWGRQGKCAGPVTVLLNLNNPVQTWTNITTLRPHWGGSCVDLNVSYKGGCTVSCLSGNCTENCSYSFNFQNGLYSNQVSFNFSRLSTTQNNGCTWYEQCEAGGNCGQYSSGKFFTSSCTDSACRTIKGQQVCPTCWNLQRQYSMFYSQNTCQSLITKGCGQIGSTCTTKDATGVCTLISNKYDCSTTVTNNVITGSNTSFNCAQTMPCVGASCFNISTQASPDFKQSATYLSMVENMSKDTNFAANLVFPGDNKKCSKYLLSAKSCCGSDKGFLFGCNQVENNLADARKNGEAHLVGSYCSNKSLFGVCLEKKESYCTFNSVLSRIIHEQGRQQIGKSWGSAQNTDCSAFTLNEIAQIDFESIDFSDFISVLKYNKNPNLTYNPNNFQGNP